MQRSMLAAALAYVVMPVEFGLGHPGVVRMMGADKLTDSLGRTAAVVGPYLVGS